MPEAPRIPRHPEERYPPHILVLVYLALTACGIAMLYGILRGSWELWRWFVRVLMS